MMITKTMMTKKVRVLALINDCCKMIAKFLNVEMLDEARGIVLYCRSRLDNWYYVHDDEYDVQRISCTKYYPCFAVD